MPLIIVNYNKNIRGTFLKKYFYRLEEHFWDIRGTVILFPIISDSSQKSY